MNENETLVYSASGRTTHFNLPLYHAEDKVKYLTDWNISMEEIDKLLFEMKSSGDINKTDIASIKERLTIAEDGLETVKTDLASLTVSVGENSTDIEQIQKDLIAQNSLVKTMSDTIITIQNTLDEYEEKLAILESKMGLVYPRVIMNDVTGDKYFPIAVYGNELTHMNSGVMVVIPKPDESMGTVSVRIGLYYGNTSPESDKRYRGNILGNIPYINVNFNSTGLTSYTIHGNAQDVNNSDGSYFKTCYLDCKKPDSEWVDDDVTRPITYEFINTNTILKYKFSITQREITDSAGNIIGYGVIITVSTDSDTGQHTGFFDVTSVVCCQSKFKPNSEDVSTFFLKG